MMSLTPARTPRQFNKGGGGGPRCSRLAHVLYRPGGIKGGPERRKIRSTRLEGTCVEDQAVEVHPVQGMP